VYDGDCKAVTFSDEYGAVNVYLLPFVKPVNVRTVCEEFTGETYHAAVEYAVGRMNLRRDERNLLVTHQYVIAGESRESDEVGGTGMVSASLFDAFDYAALGHLHGGHPVGKSCYYSGSPLKHSFGEVNDVKTVSVVELKEKGTVIRTEVPLHPLRDLREVRGSYDEVVHAGLHDPAKEDYLRVILTDEDDVIDAVAKLRCVYPNLMRLSYDNLRTREMREIGGISGGIGDDAGAIRPEEVFAELYELQNNVPPDEELLDVVRGIFETCGEMEK